MAIDLSLYSAVNFLVFYWLHSLFTGTFGQKHLARKLGLEGVLVLQVLLSFGTPGKVIWLCRYL